MAFIVLTGASGAGKTETGKALAGYYGVDFCDVDQLIVESASLTIPEIFARHGEEEFRRLEQLSVDHALRDFPGIVTLGGGAVLSERTRNALKGLFVVYLKVSVDEGMRRINSQAGTRPLLFQALGENATDEQRRQAYVDLLHKRSHLYESVSTVTVETTGKSMGLIIAEISAHRAQWIPPHNNTYETFTV